MLVLKGLTDLAGWHYLVAATVAFVAGASVAYLLVGTICVSSAPGHPSAA